jgi:ankyrin repeat protein
MNKLKQYIALFLLVPTIAYAAPDSGEAWQAVAERDAQKLTTLIKEGANPNERNENGDTLLYYAVKHKAPVEILRILIESGADVNAPSSESGMTPLVYMTMTADRTQRIILQKLSRYSGEEKQNIAAGLKAKAAKNMRYAAKVIRFLVENGANVNQQTPFGTALMNAAKNPWNAEIIEFLLKSGADINICDRNGRSALFYAVVFADNETVMQLLAADADPEIKDINGKTYLEIEKEDMLES